jgi:transposase
MSDYVFMLFRGNLPGAHAPGWESHPSNRVGSGGRPQEIGEGLREQAQQMFHAWHRGRDATLLHAEFRVLMRPIRRHIARLLKTGQTCGMAKTEGVCREVLKVYDALWTFVRVEGVEPTNNAAERALRPGVLWRQGSFGPRVPTGRALSRP